MTDRKVTLGIDIGGTNTVFGLVDQNGKSYYHNSLPTATGGEPEKLFDQIHITISDFLGDSELNLAGIGIGAPNANYYSGKIENPVNLDWGFVNAVDYFKKLSGKQAFITNDANAAAIGEMRFGVATEMQDFIEITLGTGLGSGIVVNGQVVYGQDGFAGELGHVEVVENGRECGCGKKGCLETYASASGIVRTVLELLANYRATSPLRKIQPEDLSSKTVYELAMDGDTIANRAFEVTGYRLGKAFANFVTAFSPEAFILYGGLANAGDILIEPTQEAMENNLMSAFKNKVEILLSGLPADEVAVLGTAALAWHELEK